MREVRGRTHEKFNERNSAMVKLTDAEKDEFRRRITDHQNLVVLKNIGDLLFIGLNLLKGLRQISIDIGGVLQLDQHAGAALDQAPVTVHIVTSQATGVLAVPVGAGLDGRPQSPLAGGRDPAGQRPRQGLFPPR